MGVERVCEIRRGEQRRPDVRVGYTSLGVGCDRPPVQGKNHTTNKAPIPTREGERE